MFGAGIAEIADTTGDDRLADLARLYGTSSDGDALANAWDAVAAAALPDAVPAFRRTRELQRLRAAAYRARGTAGLPELRGAWEELAAIRETMRDSFPLTPPQTEALLHDLADRVDAVATAERDALEALRAVTG